MKTSIDVKYDKVEFNINLSAKEFNEKLDQRVDDKIKNVEMDGFRKGKMPKTMFIKKYGYDSVIPDAIDEIINEGIDSIVKKNKLQFFGNVDINWDKMQAQYDKPFKLSGTFAVVPEISIKDYEKVHEKIEKEQVSVSDDEVNKEIDHLLNQKAILELSDEASSLGDTVVIDFEGSVDGETFPGGSSKNYPLELGSNSFIPGFEEQLVGYKAPSEVDVKVVFPQDYHEASLAGKDAIFKTTIHEVKKRVLPTLDDELVKEFQIPEVTNVSELQTMIKSRLLAQKQEQANITYGHKVFEQIIKDNNIEIPQTIVDIQTNQILEDFKKDIKARGIEFDMFVQLTGQNEDTLKEQMSKEARERVMNSMIINAVINDQNLKVSTSEYNEEIKKIAEAQKTTQKAIKEQIKANNLEANIKENMLVDKAIKIILGE